jgi:hypothetical protein
MYFIRDIAIGIGMYLAVTVGGYVVLMISALFADHSQRTGLGALSAFAGPFFVAGVLFVATSVVLFRLPAILASMSK